MIVLSGIPLKRIVPRMHLHSSKQPPGQCDLLLGSRGLTGGSKQAAEVETDLRGERIHAEFARDLQRFLVSRGRRFDLCQQPERVRFVTAFSGFAGLFERLSCRIQGLLALTGGKLALSKVTRPRRKIGLDPKLLALGDAILQESQSMVRVAEADQSQTQQRRGDGLPHRQDAVTADREAALQWQHGPGDVSPTHGDKAGEGEGDELVVYVVAGIR